MKKLIYILLVTLSFASCTTDSEYLTKKDLKGIWSGGYAGLDMEMKFTNKKCFVTAFRDSGTETHEATYSFEENKGIFYFENNSPTFEVIEHSSGELILFSGDAILYKD